jgi:uncharacterized protein (DUF1499 family)
MLASVRDVWVRGALAVSGAAVLYFLTAAWGVKFGLIDWGFGFGRMTVRWGPIVIISAAVIAAAAAVLALAVPPRRGIWLALLALAIPAAMLGYGQWVKQQAAGIAPIHDITTDFIDPPAYSDAVAAARAAMHANSLDLANERVPQDARFGAAGGKRVMQVQADAYADIISIPSGLPPDRVFDMALDLARQQPWKLGLVDKQNGRIEAMAESFWFGFKDDIVIRIRPDGAGTRVDMRSASRVGVSDLGANARRLRAYLAALRAQVQDAES